MFLRNGEENLGCKDEKDNRYLKEFFEMLRREGMGVESFFFYQFMTTNDRYGAVIKLIFYICLPFRLQYSVIIIFVSKYCELCY